MFRKLPEHIRKLRSVARTVSGRVRSAGIHFGEYIEKDMIAVRVSQDQRPAIVGSPTYFKSCIRGRESPRDLDQPSMH